MSLPRREPTEAAKMAWGVYNDGFAPATAQEHEIKRAFLDGYQDAEDERIAQLEAALKAVEWRGPHGLSARVKKLDATLEKVERKLRAFMAGQLTTGQDCADLVRKIRETET